MSQGLLPYEVGVGGGADTLTGRAGLPLVVETLRALEAESARTPATRAAARDRRRWGRPWGTDGQTRAPAKS